MLLTKHDFLFYRFHYAASAASKLKTFYRGRDLNRPLNSFLTYILIYAITFKTCNEKQERGTTNSHRLAWQTQSQVKRAIHKILRKIYKTNPSYSSSILHVLFLGLARPPPWRYLKKSISHGPLVHSPRAFTSFTERA